jgi:hypothetical protein
MLVTWTCICIMPTLSGVIKFKEMGNEKEFTNLPNKTKSSKQRIIISIIAVFVVLVLLLLGIWLGGSRDKHGNVSPDKPSGSKGKNSGSGSRRKHTGTNSSSTGENIPEKPSGAVRQVDSKTLVDSLLQNSKEFYTRVGFNQKLDNSISSVISSTDESKVDLIVHVLAHFAKDTRPFVHGSVLDLMAKFLEYKKSFGTDSEKLYYEEMGIETFAQRLLTHR